MGGSQVFSKWMKDLRLLNSHKCGSGCFPPGSTRDLLEPAFRRKIGHENHWHIRRRDDREHCFTATGGRPRASRRRRTLFRRRTFFLVRSYFFFRIQAFFEWQRRLSISPALFLAAVVPAPGLLSFQLIPTYLFAGGGAQPVR